LIGSLTVFAIGYLARPLGGILFGHLGDKFGRKRTFVITVFLMAVPTFCIGLLPTYQQMGILAPCLLVVLRLLQGFSVGGEIPGAIVFAAETVMKDHRGFAIALVFFGVNVGLLAGSLISGMLLHHLPPAQIISWGWRLPFFLGGALGIVSYYLRKKLRETPAFELMVKNQTAARWPIREIVTRYPVKAQQGIIVTALQAVLISLLYLYLPTYLSTFFHFSLPALLTLTTVNILLFNLPVLLLGYCSDKMGRKKIILPGVIFFCLFPYPLFMLFEQQRFSLVIFVTVLCGIFVSCVASCFSCMLTELFPTPVRYSGVALGYNIGFGIFGGLTPLLATLLIQWSKNPLAPAWYLMAVALLALIALLFMRETYRDVLTQ
jgi:MFS family permease